MDRVYKHPVSGSQICSRYEQCRTRGACLFGILTRRCLNRSWDLVRHLSFSFLSLWRKSVSVLLRHSDTGRVNLDLLSCVQSRCLLGHALCLRRQSARVKPVEEQASHGGVDVTCGDAQSFDAKWRTRAVAEVSGAPWIRNGGSSHWSCCRSAGSSVAELRGRYGFTSTRGM